MALLLALAAALGWGSSDFAAGRASRHSPVIAVVMVTHLVSLGCIALMALRWPLPTVVVRHPAGAQWLGLDVSIPAFSIRGSPLGSDLLWGAGAGISAGVGAALLFRGLVRGRASLVAPITAVGAATLPLLWTLLRGSPLSATSGFGMGVGLLAILLISMTGDGEQSGEPGRRDQSGEDGDGAASNGGDELEPTRQAAPHAPTVSGPMAMAAGRVRSSSVPWAAGVAAAVFPATLAISLLGVVFQAAASTSGSPKPFSTNGSLGAALLAGAGAAAIGWVALHGLSRESVLRTGWADRVVRGDPAVRADRADRVGRADQVGRAGLGEALLSGIGFGLFFVLLDQTGSDAGVWPMVAARTASVCLFVLAALLTRTTVLPAAGSRWTSVLAGVLDGIAAASFLVATHYLALSVVVVITSLYPVVTVLLALVVDHQRLCRRHVVGLTLAVVAVMLLVLAR